MVAQGQQRAVVLPLYRQMTWWSLLFPVAMIAALAARSLYLLNWVHVLSGAMWTGADLFMGYIIGPLMRKLDPASRAALIGYLVPRTILYFPMVSLTASTAGWLLASQLGFVDPASPKHNLVIVALVIVTVLTIQGLGVLLPNSIRMWLEMRRDVPDRKRIMRLARINFSLAGFQGLMQIAIILVMARFVIG